MIAVSALLLQDICRLECQWPNGFILLPLTVDKSPEGNKTRRKEFPHPTARKSQQCLTQDWVFEGNTLVSGMGSVERNTSAYGSILVLV